MVDHDRTAARDKMKCLIYKCQCKSFVPDRKYYRQRLAFAISGRISLIASDAVTTLNESSRSSILSSFFINIGIKANLVLSKTSNASFMGESISRGTTELSIICDAFFADSLDNQSL